MNGVTLGPQSAAPGRVEELTWLDARPFALATGGKGGCQGNGRTFFPAAPRRMHSGLVLIMMWMSLTLESLERKL